MIERDEVGVKTVCVDDTKKRSVKKKGTQKSTTDVGSSLTQDIMDKEESHNCNNKYLLYT